MTSPTTPAPQPPLPGQLSLVELQRLLRVFSEATNPVDGQDWRIMTWVEGQIAAVEAAMEVEADRMATLETALSAANARIAELEEALKPFVFGSATMEQILWGKLDDSASGTITVKLGDFRRARAALHADKPAVASTEGGGNG